MKLKIFEDSFYLYQGGYVKLIHIKKRVALFNIDDVKVRVEARKEGLRFNCECEFHKHKMLQNRLCKRIVASIIFIKNQKKEVRLPLIQAAEKIKDRLGVWVNKKEDKRIIFEVNNIPVIVKKTPNGTEIKCYCEYHMNKIIKDVYCIESLATIMWLYDKKGKIK